jgi:hypothetical protein
VSAQLNTPAGSYNLPVKLSGSGGSYAALALALRQPTDRFRVFGASTRFSGGTGMARGIFRESAAPADLAVTLPAEITPPTITYTTGVDAPRPQATFLTNASPLADKAYVLFLSQRNVTWQIALGAHWVGAGAMAAYTAPNLGPTPGWMPSFDLARGISTSTAFAIVDTTDLASGVLTGGTEFRVVETIATTTP